MPIADASSAGVARFTGNSSLPIGIDEAEPAHQWVMDLLPTLRVASSGAGARVRADAHGGVSVSHSRFSAILSSTIAPNLAKADATRITEVGLATEGVDDWPKLRRAILNAMRHADGVRYKIFRDAQSIVHETDRLTGKMQDLGMDSREAMASAAFTAGWRWWGVDNHEVLSQPETSERTDASDALLEILSLRHTAGGITVSVAEMLTNTLYEAALLDLFGMRRMGSEIWIAEKHHGLRAAMSRSKWASADLRKLLLQMDGVFTLDRAVRFGSALRTRAIVIPADSLAAAGVDLGEFGQQEELHPEEHHA